MSDAPSGDIRLSDGERLHALEALGTHYAEGRLDDAEFHQRSGDVSAARTLREVEPSFADLPGGSPLRGVDGRIVLAAGAGRADSGPGAGPSSTDLARRADDAEAELEAVRRKGRRVDAIDGAAFAVAIAVFFVLQFAFDVSHAWIVFPVMFGVLAVNRSFNRFGDDDEEVWEAIKEKDAEDRKKRLLEADRRIHELGEGRER